MFRLFYILISFVFIGMLIYFLIELFKPKKKIDEFNLQQSTGLLKLEKNDVYYWYEKPHWFIFPNSGIKINLSEYFTYFEWQNMSEEKRMQRLVIIERKLIDCSNETKIYMNN
ncbi:MAG: hypothetical protein IJH39_05595 [Clostridia bacterium]|nr:hypothetical protein [Clostridia bacterium]